MQALACIEPRIPCFNGQLRTANVCPSGKALCLNGKQFTHCFIRKRSSPFCCTANLQDSQNVNPFQMLGLSENCSEEDIKSAFRAKVKEYHPDVYKGEEDAVLITQKLIEAYEFLLKQVQNGSPVSTKRKTADPFENPECEAEQVFVYEFNCIGRGCPYSCVERAPGVFAFSSDTGRARAVRQGSPDDYAVQLAVGQCPQNCIYYVTPLQREILERVLQRALDGTMYSDEIALLESLISCAQFENGRHTPSKRQPKRTSDWVDWY